MIARSIPQAELTEECWIVQFEGLDACEECEAKDTPDCGGAKIRQTGKNKKGHEVPLGDEIETENG